MLFILQCLRLSVGKGRQVGGDHRWCVIAVAAGLLNAFRIDNAHLFIAVGQRQRIRKIQLKEVER